MTARVLRIKPRRGDMEAAAIVTAKAASRSVVWFNKAVSFFERYASYETDVLVTGSDYLLNGVVAMACASRGERVLIVEEPVNPWEDLLRLRIAMFPKEAAAFLKRTFGVSFDPDCFGGDLLPRLVSTDGEPLVRILSNQQLVHDDGRSNGRGREILCWVQPRPYMDAVFGQSALAPIRSSLRKSIQEVQFDHPVGFVMAKRVVATSSGVFAESWDALPSGSNLKLGDALYSAGPGLRQEHRLLDILGACHASFFMENQQRYEEYLESWKGLSDMKGTTKIN